MPLPCGEELCTMNKSSFINTENHSEDEELPADVDAKPAAEDKGMLVHSADYTTPPRYGGPDTVDYVMSDEELDFFALLNENPEYTDYSQADLDTVTAPSVNHRSFHTAFSSNMSSTTSSAATEQRNSHLIMEHHEDTTTTSYNTEEGGYADDESENRIHERKNMEARYTEDEDHEVNLTPQPNPPPSPSRQSLTRTASTGHNVIPPSASLFRYLRSWGRFHSDVAGAESGAENNNATTGNAVGDLTSDEDDDDASSSPDETSWADDDDDECSETSIDNKRGRAWEEPVDWNHLPILPNRFCVPVHPPPSSSILSANHTSIPHYLDSSLLLNANNLTVKEADEFVREHGTLLQAVLQLLAERDQVGVEGSTDSTENIWKKGPLKKLSFAVGRRKHQAPGVAGAWKVKYVELRQGNLCYYEDSVRTGRKMIHLRQADTLVQESSYRGPGFVFELLVQGSPTRHWMASSEEERQAWIKAIQSALIGNEAPRKELDLQPYEESLRVYTSLRESLQQADSQEIYLAAIKSTMKELASLQVPVQWVQERIEHELSPILLGTLKPPKFGRSPQKLLKSSITEFWENMGQTTFSINGLTVPRSSQLASERIMGALTRCILEFDKAFLTSAEERDDGTDTVFDGTQSQISELQAVSYARHILLTVLRSKERQDGTFVVRYLLENPGVIVSEQHFMGNHESSVQMEVSFAGEDLPDEFLHPEEMAAWVWTRTRRKNQSAIAASVSTGKWKQRHTFAVLSGTVLSYYAAASPRPHGLRGQLVLSATTTVRDEGEEIAPETGDGNSNIKNNGVRYVLCICSDNHQDRLLSFESQVDAVAWKEAIQLAIDSAGSLQSPPRVVTTTTTTPLMAPAKMLKGAERVIKVAADGTIQSGIRVIKGAKDSGIRVIKGAKDGGIRVIRTATGSGFKVIRGAVGMLRQSKSVDDDQRDRRRPSLQILLNNTIVHGKREPTVQCVFQMTQTFLIRDTEQGSENETDHSPGDEDGWMSVQAKLYQAFLMSGGPSGRIARGNALVELDFVETKVEPDEDASC